jgi:uncharacterized coiled-coil protein SlyX
MEEQQINARIAALEKQVATYRNLFDVMNAKLSAMHQTFIKNAPRVRIKNLEGSLKTFPAEPDTSLMEEGSIFLVNQGADHKIGVKIGGVIRYTGVT